MSLGGQLPCRSGLWHASCPSYGTILYRVVFVRRRISHVGVLALVVASCHGGSAAKTTSRADTLFAEDFESGDLSAWDGVDPTHHQVVSDPSGAQSGSRYLQVTYSTGGEGGWLTHFFMPGYDSIYVSYYVRFPTNWQGGTKLIALYGSRTDNQWSALGKAGLCPNGTDFFGTWLITEVSGNPGPTRFYSYYPAMAREPDGVTCWGRYGDGSETYVPPLTLNLGAWHHVEFWVKLNTPGQANASQTFWLDGVQRGNWAGFSFRASTILRLNAVQFSFSGNPTGASRTLYVDHLVVTTGTRPRDE